MRGNVSCGTSIIEASCRLSGLVLYRRCHRPASRMPIFSRRSVCRSQTSISSQRMAAGAQTTSAGAMRDALQRMLVIVDGYGPLAALKVDIFTPIVTCPVDHPFLHH